MPSGAVSISRVPRRLLSSRFVSRRAGELYSSLVVFVVRVFNPPEEIVHGRATAWIYGTELGPPRVLVEFEIQDRVAPLGQLISR